jgi:hypothetical protein
MADNEDDLVDYDEEEVRAFDTIPFDIHSFFHTPLIEINMNIYVI